jgi:hypothetical protein
MNVEGLACAVVGLRQVYVAVIFSDERPEAMNGLPVALVRGCAVARNQAELARLLCPGAEPVGVQLYVEPDTTQAELCALWMAGFRVKLVRAAEFYSVPGWWHLAAHRHHAAMTRGLRGPRSRADGQGSSAGPLPSKAARPAAG